MTEADDSARECDRLRTQLEVERSKAQHFYDRWAAAGAERDRLAEEMQGLREALRASEATCSEAEDDRDSAIVAREEMEGERDQATDEAADLELEVTRLRLGLGSTDDLPGTGPLISEPADRTAHYQRIERFHEGMGRHDPRRPTIPDLETRVARARMLFEECLEAVKALGAEACVVGHDMEAIPLGQQRDPDKAMEQEMDQPGTWWVAADRAAPDDVVLEHVAKELADVSVVATGTLVCCGILDRGLLEEVDRNNASKLHGGVARFRSDGKLLKPDSYQQPDISRVLERQPRR